MLTFEMRNNSVEDDVCTKGQLTSYQTPVIQCYYDWNCVSKYGRWSKWKTHFNKIVERKTRNGSVKKERNRETEYKFMQNPMIHCIIVQTHVCKCMCNNSNKWNKNYFVCSEKNVNKQQQQQQNVQDEKCIIIKHACTPYANDIRITFIPMLTATK